MATSIVKFGYEVGAHGLRFTVGSHGLSGTCLTHREIDEHRDRLKDELAAVAGRMKTALKRRPAMSEPGNA